MKRPSLKSDPEKRRAFHERARKSSAESLSKSRGSNLGKRPGKPSSLGEGRGFAASRPQREKAKKEPCVVTGYHAVEGYVVDPAHLWPRARGGCADPLCTVPLWRPYHRAFDEGDFDLLPYLVGRRVPELQHALEHADGDLIALLERLTGTRWIPANEEANDDCR